MDSSIPLRSSSVVEVRGPGLTARFDPIRGGKIVSLRDQAGVEWLAQGVPRASVAVGSNFVDAEMCGWDECAPTIVSCRVGGNDLPDHGDLWDAPFDVEDDGSTATAVGSSLGYLFRRAISATSVGLRIDYEVSATDKEIPFMWAAHPQFLAPPGTKVELSNVDIVVDVLSAALNEVAWTPTIASIDSLKQGECRKVYVPPNVTVDSARLVKADGSALSMRWSRECPYLGIWFDKAAYSHEPVVALEPASGYFDSLALAIENGRAPTVEPGRPLRWWLKIQTMASE